MNKEEFLKELESRLQGLPKGDIKERVEIIFFLFLNKLESIK